MSKFLRHRFTLFVCIAFIPFLNACSDLGKAKGTIIDVITHKPVSDAQIVATTSSDLESEQKHLRYTTTTDRDGNFVIKGIKGKYYSITVTKNGYTNAQLNVSIPEESAKLIKKPISICPLPPGEGLFVYTDHFVKIEKAKPYSVFNNNGLNYAYYKSEDLKDLPPTRAQFIIKYGEGPSDAQKMYWLFRRSKKENLGESENDGDYFVIGGYHSQFAETYGSFSIDSYYGRRAEFKRSASDNRRNHFWGSLERVYYDRNHKLRVFEVSSNIPRGYYLMAYGNRHRNRMVGKDAYLLNLQ